MSRQDRMPADAVEKGLDTDDYPPVLPSDECFDSVPLPSPGKRVGAEDSPFVLLDGSTLSFFFAPDLRLLGKEHLLEA